MFMVLSSLVGCLNHCNKQPPLDFGEVLVGTTALQTVFIECPDDVARGDDDAPDAPFAFAGEVDEDGDRTLEVVFSFSPDAVGSFSSTAVVGVSPDGTADGKNTRVPIDLAGVGIAADIPTGPVDVAFQVRSPSGPLVGIDLYASNPGCVPCSTDAQGTCQVGNTEPDANLVIDGRFAGEHGWVTLPPEAWIAGRAGGTLTVSLPDDTVLDGSPVASAIGILTLIASQGAILRYDQLVPDLPADAWLAGLGFVPASVLWSAHIDAGLLPTPVTVSSDTPLPEDATLSLIRSSDGGVVPIALDDPSSFTVPAAGIVVLQGG